MGYIHPVRRGKRRRVSLGRASEMLVMEKRGRRILHYARRGGTSSSFYANVMYGRSTYLDIIFNSPSIARGKRYHFSPRRRRKGGCIPRAAGHCPLPIKEEGGEIALLCPLR